MFRLASRARDTRTTMKTKVCLGIAACGLCLNTHAVDRLFTYSYEPETMPKGAMEFEQWITLGSGRTKKVGTENYNRWEFREELEYGVTDYYTISFYLNTQSESYRDTSTGSDFSKFSFKGISVANRIMLLNPAEHKVGVSLYLEPTFSGNEAAFEQKLLLGQRFGGKYKWTANLIHETEWENNFHETVGEVEATFGISRELTKNWWLGIEARNKNELPEYKEWESTAFYLGPAVHYRQDKFWATLTIMPQIWGMNFSEDRDPDGNGRIELEDNEKLNIRLIMGFHF